MALSFLFSLITNVFKLNAQDLLEVVSSRGKSNIWKKVTVNWKVTNRFSNAS